jgi:hypothetical protein
MTSRSPFPLTAPEVVDAVSTRSAWTEPVEVTRMTRVVYRAPYYEITAQSASGPTVIKIRWIIEEVRWMADGELVVFHDRSSHTRYVVRHASHTDRRTRRILAVFV